MMEKIIEVITRAFSSDDSNERITQLWYAEFLIKSEIFKLEIDEREKHEKMV